MARPDFPRTFAAFQAWFASEEDCWRYLLASRWPDGFRCPRCGDAAAYSLASRALLQCRACRHQTSVTAGTVLHRTRLPLSLWFAAAYLVATHTPGFSALQLQRQLGLGRYETAFVMLQKLRRAMRRPERDRLPHGDAGSPQPRTAASSRSTRPMSAASRRDGSSWGCGDPTPRREWSAA